ncbi:MAG: hypothetical protein RLZZ126_2124 [Pseudomonadota bacterium]|jgi:pimeloyl-ACP methyl ester carboxylesterase
MKIRANGIDIEVEDSHPGDVTRPVVLLVMGLGMQLIAWPDDLVGALTGAGYRVIRHDNRDIGLSQHMDHLGQPNLFWALVKSKFGLRIYSPYTLGDMAQDAVGVLDGLGVRQVHVVGASMGGMIAQRMALHAGDRLLSLTSIMSSSGARGLPQASPEVIQALLSPPRSTDPEALASHAVRLFRLIGSPAFRLPDAELHARSLRSIQRSFHPQGTARQMMAIAADGARAELLGRIKVPTLVIHGKDDALVPFACGEDTARRISGARLHAIEGMGHDLPPGVIERILPPLLQHLRGSHEHT